MDAIFATFIQKGLYLVFLILLFAILNRVGKYLIDKSFKQYSKKSVLNESRLKTLHSLLNTIFQYTMGFFFIYAILSVIGVPIGSLLAGAGIARVAIGLGAQGFMSDVITGFFIIMEQQMDVGDYVKLAKYLQLKEQWLLWYSDVTVKSRRRYGPLYSQSKHHDYQQSIQSEYASST